MTRASLLQIIDHVSAISDSEIRELEQLAATFPYCQTAHILLAKAAHDQGSMLASQRLRRAATYAADRQLLRQLIEMPAPVFVAEPAAVFAPSEVGVQETEAEALPSTEAPKPADFAATEASDALPLAAAELETLAAEESSTSAQTADSLDVESDVNPESSKSQAVENLPEVAVSEVSEAETADIFAVTPEAEPDATEQQTAVTSEQAEPWPPAVELSQEQEVAEVTTKVEAEEPAATTADSEVPAEAVVTELTYSEQIEHVIETPAAPAESLEAAPEPVEPVAQEAVAENTVNTSTVEAVIIEQSVSQAAVATPESPEQPTAGPEEDLDILPPVAPPIQPPMSVGSSRFEFGLGLPEAGTNGYELPTLPDEEKPAAAPASVITDFRGDDHIGYALGGGSRMGFCLLATDADLTRPLPDTDFFAPDALLHQHAVSTRPAPAPFDLINNFLRNQPRLRTPAPRPAAAEEQADLSVRSTQGVPAIASESLAKIMVRQGKVEKAIEIYERLMVRQPEKKAYFADQIQQLKPTE